MPAVPRCAPGGASPLSPELVRACLQLMPCTLPRPLDGCGALASAPALSFKACRLRVVLRWHVTRDGFLKKKSDQGRSRSPVSAAPRGRRFPFRDALEQSIDRVGQTRELRGSAKSLGVASPLTPESVSVGAPYLFRVRVCAVRARVRAGLGSILAHVTEPPASRGGRTGQQRRGRVRGEAAAAK